MLLSITSAGAFGTAMLGAVSQGVIWGIMALGVYITFKILDFPDMTVDGSFATGGCVSALLLTNGFNPLLSLFVAMAAGAAAGSVTGFLNTKLKIPGILSGILMMLALYSINLHILGKPNQPLSSGIKSVFTPLINFMKSKGGDATPVVEMVKTNLGVLIIGFAFALAIVAVLYWFFGTELGSSIRSTGDNEKMSRAMGINTDRVKIIALMISNSLVSLSGALVMQQQRVGDINMGIGTIVIGLASIIIGEVIIGKRFSFLWHLISVMVGSVIYRIIIAFVLQLGMKSQDMKLLSATVVALALSIPVLKRTLASFRKNRKGE